jgi:hypothetical protein
MEKIIKVDINSFKSICDAKDKIEKFLNDYNDNEDSESNLKNYKFVSSRFIDGSMSLDVNRYQVAFNHKTKDHSKIIMTSKKGFDYFNDNKDILFSADEIKSKQWLV